MGTVPTLDNLQPSWFAKYVGTINPAPVTLMRSAIKTINVNGRLVETLVYQREEPAEWQCQAKIEFDDHGKRWSWWRAECRALLKGGGIEKGDCMFVARYPYSLPFVGVAPFKTPRREIYRLKSSNNLANIIEQSEKTTRDFWQTGSDYLVAGIGKPSQEYFEGNPVRIRNISNPIMVLGVCKPYHEEILLQSPEILRMLEEAEMDEFWAHMIIGGKHTRHYNSKLIIPTEVKVDLWDIMRKSVYCALAGPRKQTEFWQGKQVYQYVRFVFEDLIKARVKRHEYQLENFPVYKAESKTHHKSEIPGLEEEEIRYIQGNNVEELFISVLQDERINEVATTVTKKLQIMEGLIGVVMNNKYTRANWYHEDIVKSLLGWSKKFESVAQR